MTEIVSFERAALLVKKEVTYGTDPVPAGATDAVQIANGRIRFQANKLTREIDQPYLGARPFVLTGRQAIIEFDIELLGDATAGNASPFGPLLEALGCAETLSPAVDARYNPISASFASATAYFYVPGGNPSGSTQHIVSGIRGNMVANMSINNYLKARVTIEGQEATLSDVAFPALTLTAFQAPIAIDESTWAVTADDGGGAFNLDCVELEIDLGQRPQLIETSEQQVIQIFGRDATGFLRIIDPALSDLDAWTLAKNGTLVDVQAAVTGGAGKNATISLPTCQFEYPERISIDGASGLRIPLTALPTSAGNDEIEFIFS